MAANRRRQRDVTQNLMRPGRGGGERLGLRYCSRQLGEQALGILQRQERGGVILMEKPGRITGASLQVQEDLQTRDKDLRTAPGAGRVVKEFGIAALGSL
jgi:hypothetical protein